MTDLVADSDLSAQQPVLRISRRRPKAMRSTASAAGRHHANWAIWLLFWAVVAMGCTMAVAVASVDV